MQIEFIGCTSAGKSSVAGGTLRAGRDRRLAISMADDYVLRRWRLQWVRSRLARTLVIDVLSLLACIATWRDSLAFLRFAAAVVRRLPIGAFQKANMVRNVAKRVGVHAMIGRYRSGGDVVLVDEGTLQSAHYLFVHVAAEAAAADLAHFASLVPLPDIVVYVMEDERVLIERTLQRGHARIPDPSPETVERFVKRAVAAFDALWQEAVGSRRILVAERGDGILIGARHHDDVVRRAVDIVQAGVDARYCSGARGPSGFSPQALSRRLARILWRSSTEN